MSIASIVSAFGRKASRSSWRMAWMAREGYTRIPLTTEVFPEMFSTSRPSKKRIVAKELVPDISYREPETPLNDDRLFEHDNRSLLDSVDALAETGILPPVSRIGLSRDPVLTFSDDFEQCWFEPSDQSLYERGVDYQKLHDRRYDRIATSNWHNVGPRKIGGEGFMGFSDHVSELSGFDRMIVEDCHDGSGNVQRQNMNIPQTPRRYRAEWILKRLSKTVADLVDCDVICECFRTLEFTQDMVEIWINRFNDSEDDLAYFDQMYNQLIDLSFAVSEVEQPSVEWQTNPDNGHNWELDMKAERYWNGISAIRTWNGIIINEMEVPESDEYEMAVDEVMDWENPDGRDQSASDVFRYQRFANDIGDRNSWIKAQPERYQKLLRAVKETKSLDKLSKLGSLVHDGKFKLTAEQAVAFWGKSGSKDGAYYRRKTVLEAAEKRHAGSFVDKAVNRIYELKSIPQLKYAAYKLVQIQKGEITVDEPPTKWGWKAIWNAWHQRKDSLIPKMSL